MSNIQYSTEANIRAKIESNLFAHLYSKVTFSSYAVNIFSTVTQGDLGSPLTRFVKDKDDGKNYIIGVTFRRYVGNNSSLLRFVRIHYVLDSIKEMEEKLQSPTANNASYTTTSNKGWIDKKS